MSVEATYLPGEEITCPNCGNGNTDFSVNFGSVMDSDGKKWDYSALKCRDCGHRWEAHHPWVVEIDEAVERVVEDVIESFILAIGDNVTETTRDLIVTTVRDACSNNFDTLTEYFNGGIYQ